MPKFPHQLESLLTFKPPSQRIKSKKLELAGLEALIKQRSHQKMELLRATHRHQLVADSLGLKEPANPSTKQLALMLREIFGRPTYASLFRIFENERVGAVDPQIMRM